MEYQKIKSVAKEVLVKGPDLEKIVLETMKTISSVVGATLGPGGRAVLIERFEYDLPAMVTKDGVTVFRSLGFADPAAHCIMECARDAAVRTASEAGDGTSSATVLAEAIVRLTNNYCKENPRVTPQKVVRRLEAVFRDTVEPAIKSMASRVDPSTSKGREMLAAVAKISANGEQALASAVMECFDLVGDEGNVTIVESSGPSHYEVERMEGYAIPMGYEESCAKFYPSFVNDPATQKCVLDNPVFVCYHGRISEIGAVQLLLEKVGAAWEQGGYNHNVVLVATDFSESVLANLATNFNDLHSINVFPLKVPHSPLANGQQQFLMDVCAVTGATLFDPINCPLGGGHLKDLGPNLMLKDAAGELLARGPVRFEASRFRSMILGHAEGYCVDEAGQATGRYEDLLLDRVSQIQSLLQNPESVLDRLLLQEQLGKLTGGIARLKVVGASNGELKEKRDRAEDAVCAVRGAIKHGCLPGGGWSLLKLIQILEAECDPVVTCVLIPALREPFRLLLANAGYHDDEIGFIEQRLVLNMGVKSFVYDVAAGDFVDPFEGGVLDSVPAVLEAIRNSISIATLLGTLGGTVVFSRDRELERSEARDTQQWHRDASTNPADERP